MDPQQLRAFRAVAEELHFGRAAERLHLAQPHLSRIVRALEADLGAPLFRRTTRRVELTAAGAALVDPARRISQLEETARSVVRAAHDGRSGRIRIGFAGPSAHDPVAALARAVRRRHPLIDLEFVPGRYGAGAVADLLERETDLAIARFVEPPAGVASRVIGNDRCMAAVPAGHRLDRTGPVRFDELREEPQIAFPEAFGSTVRAVVVARCQTLGFTPRIVQTAPDSWTSIALVAAGVGIHITTASAVASLPRDGIGIQEISDLLPPITVELVWRKDEYDPALRRVLSTSEAVFPAYM